MAISRILSPPIGVGGKFTSSNMNAIDQNVENALDKRTGQTDTLGSVVSCSTGTAARIIPTFRITFDADTTYTVSQGITVLRATGLTATRSFTFSNTGATSGDRVHFFCNDGFPALIKNAAGTVLFQCGDGTHTDDDGQYCEIVFMGAWVLSLSGATHAGIRINTFSGSGSFTVPRGVSNLLVTGCGGGGGGCGGHSDAGATGADFYQGSGGGGGGAIASSVLVPVVPGNVLTVTIGAGGAGSAPSTTFQSPGADGADTKLVIGASTLACFAGAGGGSRSTNYQLSGGPEDIIIGLGGNPTRGAAFGGLSLSVAVGASATLMQMLQQRAPGTGGIGHVRGNARNAFDSAFVCMGTGQSNPIIGAYGLGGAPGFRGTDSATYRGGAGGGGGGGGPALPGGAAPGAAPAGGAGGNGNNGGTGTNGANGVSGVANSGAGGGGGGGAGGSSSGGATGGTGGTGGSGFMYISWTK